MTKSCCISYATDELIQKAKQIAEQYGFSLGDETYPRLHLTIEKLELLIQGFLPLYADFIGSNAQRRQAAGKHQALVRACKPAPGLRILDLTAGWGRDAAILAGLGAEVVMLERQPIMAALLEDALDRLRSSENPLLLRLCHTDSIDYLRALSAENFPDIIYIDPMHPERQKSALVKKDMQALQSLFGPDKDALELLQTAIGRAKKQVVVKWPQRLPALLKPNHSIEGKTVRFDMYVPNANSLIKNP